MIFALSRSSWALYNATMDYSAVIKALRSEQERIDRAIAQLEALNSADGVQAAKTRRLRKSMGLEERQQVAERMKRYWATRQMK